MSELCKCGGPVVDGICLDRAAAEHGDQLDVVPVEPAAPAPVLAGTFAIYEDGQGGFVLVTDTPDHGTQRKHIPGAIVKMVTGGGVIGRKFAGMFG